VNIFFWRKPRAPEPQYLGGDASSRIAELEDICRAWRDDYSALQQQKAAASASDKALIKTLRGQLQRARARDPEELSDVIGQITPEGTPLFNSLQAAPPPESEQPSTIGPIEKGIPVPPHTSAKRFSMGQEKSVPLEAMEDGDSVFVYGLGASKRCQARAYNDAKLLGVTVVSRVIDTPTQQGRRFWRFDERTKK